MYKLFEKYCSGNEAVLSIGTKVIVKLECFQQQKNLVDPRFLLNMLRSYILMPDQLYAHELQHQMLRYFREQNPEKRTTLRPEVISSIVDGQNESGDYNNLTKEEQNFANLWEHLDKFRNRFNLSHSNNYHFNFSELRRFKLQQFLFDSDLEQISHTLQSAKKLEILDLAHNKLGTVEKLFELFKSLKKLRVLDLSDNIISFDQFSKGFKFLSGLHTLNLSRNIAPRKKVTNTQNKDSFGFHLKELKKLRNLNLSNVLYGGIDGLVSGLRYLENLRTLSLSSCMIRPNPELRDLAGYLSTAKNLSVLDLSYNFIDFLPTEVAIALNHVREVNLSYNSLSSPLAELELFGCFNSIPRLRKLDLSYNFLCGDDSEFQAFLQSLLRLPELQEVDLSHNNLFLSDEIWNWTNNFKLNIHVVPFSELECSHYRQELRQLNMSQNFLGYDSEFQKFKSKLYILTIKDFEEDNIPHNTLFLEGDTEVETLKINVLSLLHLHIKSINIDGTGTTRISNPATQKYVACICRTAGYELNYEETCLKLFNRYQHNSHTIISDEELITIRTHIAFGHFFGIANILNEEQSFAINQQKDNEHMNTVSRISTNFKLHKLTKTDN